jgi:hypothetical protein
MRNCVTINHRLLWPAELRHKIKKHTSRRRASLSTGTTLPLPFTIRPIYCLTDRQQGLPYVYQYYNQWHTLASPLLRVASVCCVGSWHHPYQQLFLEAEDMHTLLPLKSDLHWILLFRFFNEIGSSTHFDVLVQEGLSNFNNNAVSW